MSEKDRELWGLLDYKYETHPRHGLPLLSPADLKSVRILPQLSFTGLGGILADVMKLGKALTMLGAVVCAKEDGLVFKSTKEHDTEHPSRQKAGTLVVLPSRL